MPLGSMAGRAARAMASRLKPLSAKLAAGTKMAAGRAPGLMRPGWLTRFGVGSFRAWQDTPALIRLPIFAGGVAALSSYKFASGMRSGYSQIMSPEDMYNRAHNLGPMGAERYTRNQGRMPSNHLSHSSIGLSLSRSRHGR